MYRHIVVFVVDTNKSMAAPCDKSFSSLEVAKCAVDALLNSNASPLKDMTDFALLETSRCGDMNIANDDSCLRVMIGEPKSKFDDAYKLLQGDRDAHLNYALHSAFGMINQYRMKEKIENFGQGRYPWVQFPTTIIVLTDGHCFNSSDSLNLRASNQYAKEPYRWDQRVFNIVIRPKFPPMNAEEKLRDETPPAALQRLADEIGGETLVCRGLKATLAYMKTLASKIGQPRVLVGLSHDPNTPSKECLAELVLKTPPAQHNYWGFSGTWPIPENFWLDRSNDTLPLRPAHPRIVYRALSSSPSDVALIEAVAAAYDVAKEIGFPIDVYEVRWLKTSLHGPPNVSNRQKYPFYALNSGRTAGLGEPFGFITASKQPGKLDFVVFPYDFVTLMPLIKQAISAAENVRAVSHTQAILSSLPQQFKVTFNTYLYNIPPYYYTCLRSSLQKYGIHGLIQERAEGGLTRGLLKNITRSIEASNTAYARSIEARRRGAEPPPPDMLSLATFIQPLPTNAADVRATDLLSQWEALRKTLFGGTSLALSGLAVKSVSGRGSFRPAKADKLSSGSLFKDCGADEQVQKTTHDMMNYTEFLMRAEAPRDPHALKPDEDEDEVQGVYRRKLNVNFGNPFKTKTAKKGPRLQLSVDERAEDLAALFMDSPTPHRDTQQDSEVVLESSLDELLPTQSRGFGSSTVQRLKSRKQREQPNPESHARNSSYSSYNSSDTIAAAVSPAVAHVEVDESSRKRQKVTQAVQNTSNPTFNENNSQLSVSQTIPTAMQEASTPLHVADPSPTSNLPAGWEMHWSGREQKHYYFNVTTGASTWVRPT